MFNILVHTNNYGQLFGSFDRKQNLFCKGLLSKFKILNYILS